MATGSAANIFSKKRKIEDVTSPVKEPQQAPEETNGDVQMKSSAPSKAASIKDEEMAAPEEEKTEKVDESSKMYESIQDEWNKMKL